MSPETSTVNFDLCMKAVDKSGRVLYAFTEFYLYFYGIGPEFLFENFGAFGCLSIAVYCVDESVEQEGKVKKGIILDHLEELVSKTMSVNDHVSGLLRDAREYCSFERAARAGEAVYDLDDVLRISKIRSVDFRLMHHALIQIRTIPYDEEVFEWFSAFEMLMEIEDDLASVKEDGLSGGYNYYCFARNVAGTNAAAGFEALRSSLESRLLTIGSSLASRGYPRCLQVVERYRKIVPRREIPIEQLMPTQNEVMR
jgi:hypothetical protein